MTESGDPVRYRNVWGRHLGYGWNDPYVSKPKVTDGTFVIKHEDNRLKNAFDFYEEHERRIKIAIERDYPLPKPRKKLSWYKRLLNKMQRYPHLINKIKHSHT